MGQKVNPKSFRLGINKPWDSRWFTKGSYDRFLEQDMMIREFIQKSLTGAGVSHIEIERSPKKISVHIHSSRPGVIIGRGGMGIENLEKEIKKKVSEKTEVKLEVHEVANPDQNAVLVAQSVSEQLEKRIPFRRTLKETIRRSKQTGVKGVKIAISGRLNGAEMSRREWLAEGNLPLQTIRADIDFAQTKAHTTYGDIGIKVWIYKGEVFKEKQDREKEQISEQ